MQMVLVLSGETKIKHCPYEGRQYIVGTPWYGSSMTLYSYGGIRKCVKTSMSDRSREDESSKKIELEFLRLDYSRELDVISIAGQSA